MNDIDRVEAHREAKSAVREMGKAAQNFSTQDLRDRALGALLLTYLSEVGFDAMAPAIIGLSDGLAELGKGHERR